MNMSLNAPSVRRVSVGSISGIQLLAGPEVFLFKLR
jgi:hypothetical protein